MTQHLLPGTYIAKKQNGDTYYRASITYKNKHISLGSYETNQDANSAYNTAKKLLESNDLTIDSYSLEYKLHFEKWVCLINYRDNGIYIKNPIYMKSNYFLYYFNVNEYYIFDIDDLFYYSEHKIMKRKGHLFVADYGMQINILSKYGIKNYARAGIDYTFINDNPYDFRLENINIINYYIGVFKEEKNNKTLYLSRLHIRSNYVIGRYPSEIEAAIAYNKAVDIVKSNGCNKNFQTNYIEQLESSQYAELYQKLKISDAIYKLTF